MFETRLNWSAWSGAVLGAIERLPGRSLAPAGAPVSGPGPAEGVAEVMRPPPIAHEGMRAHTGSPVLRRHRARLLP